MVLLESQDRYDTWAELDRSTGFYKKIQRPLNEDVYNTQGLFSELDGHLLSLYRIEDLLYFRVDSNEFLMTEDTVVHLESTSDEQRVLSLVEGGQTVVEVRYKRPVLDPPIWMDPTAAREEDFDFGLFVFNLARNPKRRAGIFIRP